ncbi:MAG: hypothetical protein NTU44_13970 [Bacteroidetes bacterium]|nr:hypothetical protein [Bacteroidota bacterium]
MTTEQDDKGFSFRRLFFRQDETGQSGKQQSGTTYQKGNNTNSPVTSGFQKPDHSQDKSLTEDFADRLHSLINQNNQPGFDFLEYTETLFEESQNPDAEVYKLVFRIAQKMDKSLTPERLIQSAAYYKDLVQKTADAEMVKGETKKQSLVAEKEAEKNNLDKSLKNIIMNIDQLKSQIQELQKQELDVRNQLAVIDQKYNGQFTDIEVKLNAIQGAKEQVIISIVDIEAGIKSNL